MQIQSRKYAGNCSCNGIEAHPRERSSVRGHPVISAPLSSNAFSGCKVPSLDDAASLS